MAKLANLLKKVFLGSLAGIAANTTSTANPTTEVLSPSEDGNKVDLLSNPKPDLSLKFLLKKTSKGAWNFMSHRSHRSHSSHRSHYSSYSGGGNENNKPSKNQGIRHNYESNEKQTATLQLGSRTLKRGMSGTDVTELINILLSKNYLRLDEGGTYVTGVHSYDDIVEGAVKKFQSDNGLTSDGVCGSTTIYYLKNK